MNILHVISNLSPRSGGPAKVVLEVSKELATCGHKITIFSIRNPEEMIPNPGGSEGNDSEPPGFGGFGRIQLFDCVGPRNYGYSPSLTTQLVREIASFDILHLHGLWTYPTWTASRIAKKFGVPYVIRPCGMLDRYSMSHHPIRKKIYYELIEKENLKNAAAVHFTSEEECRRSDAELFRDRIVVIPLGVNLEDYRQPPEKGEFRNKYPHLKDQKIILFLGRLSFKKGLDLLICAFSELLKKMGQVHCVIAGPDDENYGRHVKRWIREEKIENHVTILGFQDRKAKTELFRDCDLFCLPSHQENFGLSVVEAMAAGLPVVISEHVNLFREIKEAGAGLVTPLESHELASALLALLSNDALRQSMGKRGKRLVEEHYQWSQVAQAWLNTYEVLTEAKGLASVV